MHWEYVLEKCWKYESLITKISDRDQPEHMHKIAQIKMNNRN